MWEVAEVKRHNNIAWAITSEVIDWKAQILTLDPNTWGRKWCYFYYSLTLKVYIKSCSLFYRLHWVLYPMDYSSDFYIFGPWKYVYLYDCYHWNNNSNDSSSNKHIQEESFSLKRLLYSLSWSALLYKCVQKSVCIYTHTYINTNPATSSIFQLLPTIILFRKLWWNTSFENPAPLLLAF